MFKCFDGWFWHLVKWVYGIVACLQVVFALAGAWETTGELFMFFERFCVTLLVFALLHHIQGEHKPG